MNNQVTIVAHPQTKKVITPSKNPEYGTIRVDSRTVSMEGGFANVSNRTAFIRGKVKDLEALGFKEGDNLPGKIQKQESTTPFYEGQEAKINPSTAEVMKDAQGNDLYLNYVYTEDMNAPVDVLIGAEAVKTAEAEQKVVSTDG